MQEKKINIDFIDPIEFYGANNSRLKLFLENFNDLSITARDKTIILKGEKKSIERFEKVIHKLKEFYKENKSLNNEIIKKILKTNSIKGLKEELILYGNKGKAIKSRTVNQHKMLAAVAENDMLIAVGPAGTGKTYTAIAHAVKALKDKEVKKIILSRPAVEAGEQLGYLPGDLKEKLDPYLQPLYDALYDMIEPDKLNYYFENKIIEIAPLAFMRGRTLENSFVILDEAQNATNSQLKMFLTRMGMHSKFILTGDLSQIDLQERAKSGLPEKLNDLKKTKGISVIEFDERDVLRHPLVKKIIKIFE